MVLIFLVTGLPKLLKGKGNKIIQILLACVANREEYYIALVLLNENSTLVLYFRKRRLTLKSDDLINFQKERGTAR